MFSKNKKPDSRVRFQNPRFRKQLNEARGYKRPVKLLPESRFGKILHRIGLGSWLSRILTLLAFFLLIYLVYIPNFLFVKKILISGISEQAVGSVEATTNSFLNKKLPYPQKNLLFLSKKKLTSYLEFNNKNVLKVKKITKKLGGNLFIEVEPRVDEFAIQTFNNVYLISNDGIISSEVQRNASGTLPTLPILIKLQSEEPLIVGHRALEESKAQFVVSLSEQLPVIARTSISYYQMEKLSDLDLTAFPNSGPKILFDLSQDVNKNLSELALLLSQFTDEEVKNLFYVDMRFDSRGYICKRGTLCVNEKITPQTATSTTP